MTTSPTPPPTRSDAPARPIVPATRTERIHYAVRDVVLLAQRAAAEGRDMLYLNVGDPNIFDFAPAPHVIDATIEAIRDNRNGYAPSSGIPEAVDAINQEAGRLGIRNIQHTYVTSGASEAIDLALAALANPGDGILTPSPVYPFYTAAIAKYELLHQPYELDEDRGWNPDLDDLAARITERTRAIIVINPNNPTGAVASRDTLRGIVELARRHDLVIFADEIYDKLLFDDAEHQSLAALDPEAKVITFNGMSKSYVVPGFRLGWGIVSGPAPEMADFCEAIQKMERARLSANHPEQYAIKPALEQSADHIAEMMTRLTRRRDLTWERLNAIEGISCVKPGGAFYAYPRIEAPVDDVTFVERVISETGVVIVPGHGFGQREGTHHFRVVFLPPEDVLERAYDHIERIMREFL